MRRPATSRVLLLVSALLAALLAGWQGDLLGPATPVADDGSAAVTRAFSARRSDVLVEGHGVVARILADDERGSRHQRFIVRLANGQTLLVAHNIDLAPRLPALAPGDAVRFRGEYEWNDKGGVLHWTHHDPDGTHPGGWLEHAGRRYE